ncbi:hypothetical protein, variant [Loa loa]|uniref:Uncharacterized protein n=1 Tax=Loa loa TaxID=7209 RepID=A0A1S0ULC4_LOALO|nr:hypothetical protein, variant [Loa loa]EJD76522.1 hypothetical protein, variant [Loa loa]
MLWVGSSLKTLWVVRDMDSAMMWGRCVGCVVPVCRGKGRQGEDQFRGDWINEYIKVR